MALSPKRFLYVTLAFAHLSSTATATTACACGYAVNTGISVIDPPLIFTEALETDFTHLYDFTWQNPCWQHQVYNVTANDSRGLYGMMKSIGNAQLNPFPSIDAWNGSGIHGGDAGLQMIVDSSTVDGLIPSAEIASRRKDLLYGSFRVGLELTQIPGTCTGFFWYHNDSAEIDMEVLSSTWNSSSHPVYLVMQSPASELAGYDASGTPLFSIVTLPSLDNGLHELRFDYLPGEVSFYADGQWLHSMKHDYGGVAGGLMINHWSNGNAFWSRGPPAQNAIVTVAYIKAYFNTSTPTDEKGACADEESVCNVIDLTSPPTYEDMSHDDFFLTGGQDCNEDVQATSATITGSVPSTTATSTASLQPAPSTSSCDTLGESMSVQVQASLVLCSFAAAYCW